MVSTFRRGGASSGGDNRLGGHPEGLAARVHREGDPLSHRGADAGAHVVLQADAQTSRRKTGAVTGRCPGYAR